MRRKQHKLHSSNLNLIRSGLKFLNSKDKKKLLGIMVIQVFLGFLDLLGVAAIGLVASLSITGVQSQVPGTRVESALRILGISDITFQAQVAVIGSLAAAALIIRTLTTMYFSRKILFYLSRRSSMISSEIFTRLMTQDLLVIQRRSTQETLYGVTSGVQSLMLGVIGNSVNLVSDLFLLVILATGLLVVDPAIFVITLVIFSLVSLILYFSIHNRVNKLGNISASLMIASNSSILEALNSYREIFVRNRRAYYSSKIKQSRYDLAENTAELAFIPNISKYVIEITLVVAAVIVCAFQFWLNDAVHAISTLSVFLASGSRIAPAILRIQSGAIAFKSAHGPVSQTLSIVDNFQGEATPESTDSKLEISHEGFAPTLAMSNVNFSYSENSSFNLRDVSLKVEEGEIVALVGPSGAGKTTLVDLALGVISQNSGTIKISGESPKDAIEKWPGAIAYVPQDVQIIDGTILENIAMGYPSTQHDVDLAKEALRIAQLPTLLESLNLEVGERGHKISGGQRQRLGIARALYTNPKLIILDESTSALDGKVESDLTEAISSLRGKVTIILIAHRLSTVRNSDKVVYLQNGCILDIGKFEEIRSRIVDFDSQAKLMGL